MYGEDAHHLGVGSPKIIMIQMSYLHLQRVVPIMNKNHDLTL